MSDTPENNNNQSSRHRKRINSQQNTVQKSHRTMEESSARRRNSDASSDGGMKEENEDELEFEDPVSDEYESEGEIVENNDDEDGNDQIEEEENEKRVWRAGVDALEDGDQLTYVNSAYDIMYPMHSEWPCLTLDILQDSLGIQRNRFPHTTYFVAGTQADRSDHNKLLLIRASRLKRTKYDSESEEGFDVDGGMDDEDGEEDENAIIIHREIRHSGGVNRIRLMHGQTNLKVAATWSDAGKVFIWNLTDHVAALDNPPESLLTPNVQPIFQMEQHPTEGYAMDWSCTKLGRLVTGDSKRFIYLWEPAEASWNVDRAPFSAHEGSVEDLQWSPNEETVFASCSSDKTIRIWDTRVRTAPGLTMVAHSSDVNVISWHHAVSYLMASGADDGTFRIWDLRTFGSTVSPVAHFQWHKDAISSIEWHPQDESLLAVSGADNQVTIWDLSLERDAEAEREAHAPSSAQREDLVEVPPQLLFVHLGQADPKEVHWHPQIPGLLISTAEDGFNIFKPENIFPLDD